MKTTVALGRWVLSALAGLILVPGCDSGSFVPPPPPGLGKPAETSLGSLSGAQGDSTTSTGRPAASAATAGKVAPRRSAVVGSAKIIELLLAHPSNDDRAFLTQVLRREAGKAKMVFRLVQPESGTSFSPEVLAKEIRAALGRGVSGLIVEPEEDPAVVDALREAADQGTAVLLLDRPVGSRGGKSFPCIRYGAYPESGREIVNGVLDTVNLFHRPEPARIILLHHRLTDAYADVRFKALAGPIKAAGKSFSLVEFEGDAVQAAELLQKALDAGPRVNVVFADDGDGMMAAQHVLSGWTKAGHLEFLFAGYLAYDIRSAGELMRKASACGDRSVDAFGLRTFQTLQSLLDGKPVGELVEIPILVHRKSVVFVPTPADAGKTAPASK